VARFVSVDPLAESFYYLTTFQYASNRPIDAIDLDGLEAVLVNKQKDPLIFHGGNKIKDKSAIHVVAHGNMKGIRDKNGNWINTAGEFDQMLNRESEQWKNRDKSQKTVVVLHSCRTGRCTTDKNGKTRESFAQKMSKEFENVIIVAPDERNYFTGNKENPEDSKESGPFVTELTDENGERKRDENGQLINGKRTNTPGNWNVFENGKQTGQFDGRWTPKAKADLIDVLLYKKDIDNDK